MREDLLKELEEEYGLVRAENERREAERKEKIRLEQPEIYSLVREREELVFGTLRNILRGGADTEGLPERMEQLSGAIRKKLAETGYPEDYLSPIFRCPVCQDRGKTGEPLRKPCACLKREYQRKMRERTGLSAAGRETFDTFDLNVFSDEKLPGKKYSQRDQMRLFRQICQKWAENYPDTAFRDMLLSGASGLGKTFLLHAMAEKLIERDVDVLVISAYRLIEILRKSFFSNEDSSEEMLSTQVLMIDDLGSEPLMQNVTVEQLFNLVNERQTRRLSTVISTNLNLTEFRGRYTERIASRLTDLRTSRVIALEGRDIRTGGGR